MSCGSKQVGCLVLDVTNLYHLHDFSSRGISRSMAKAGGVCVMVGDYTHQFKYL